MGNNFRFRGLFRGMFVKRWLDPKFQKLPPGVKTLLLNLELGPNSNLARIFPLYKEPLEEQTGLSRKEIDDGLKLLQKEGWILIQDGLVWIIDGLKNEALINLEGSESHVKAVQKILLSLPESDLLRKFCEHYDIEIPVEK